MPLRSGRPRSGHLRAELKLSIDARLHALVEQELQDPLTRKAKYGARSELVEELLRGWLATRGVDVSGIQQGDLFRG